MFSYTTDVAVDVMMYYKRGIGYYTEFVIVSALFALLFFFFKELFLNSLRKKYGVIFIYILFILLDLVFIILFWPIFNPEFTGFTWLIIHFFGIVYSVCVINFVAREK
ncbi:MAG: hypothetical protein GY756_10340 [bacterium]|nr:hypothetical protein [bacterium]